MPPRPIRVARAPRRLASGQLARDPSAVGVLRVLGEPPPGEIRPDEVDGPCWLVVAVVTGLRVDAPRDATFAPSPQIVPSDLVPWRPTTDVVLRGTTDPGRVTVRLGEHERRFSTVAPLGRCDLRTGLATEHRVPLVPTTALPPLESAGERWFDAADVERYQATPPPLRFPAVRGDETLLVQTPSTTVEMVLPGLIPRVRVMGAMTEMPDIDLVAFLDEIQVDVDGRTARLVWRVLVPTTRGDARDVDRLDVLFADATDVEALNRPLFDHDVPRAEFERAWELSHAEAGEPPPPLSAEDLQVARYETWDCQSPIPVLPLHEAAALSAEIAEQRETRTKVLERRGVAAYDWELEERAWAEAMAVTPGDEGGEPSLADLWAFEFARAQDALARPEEAARTPEDYARVTVALEGERPDVALRDHGLGLGAYQRLDRRMQSQAAADPAFAEHLEAAMEAERSEQALRQAGGLAPLAPNEQEQG